MLQMAKISNKSQCPPDRSRSFCLLGFEDRFDESGDVVGLGFDVRSVAEGGEGLAGDGADGGELAIFGQGNSHCEKVLGGAAAGEGDVVGAFFLENLARAGGVFGFGDGLVGHTDIDDGIEGVQSVGNDHARFVRFDPKDGLAIDELVFERIKKAFRDVLGRDEVDGEAILVDFGDGGRSDSGNFGTAEAAGVLIDRVEAFEEAFDPIGAGEDEPVISVGVAHGFGEAERVVGVLDSNGGKLDDVRPEIAELLGEFARLFAGAGHHDALAEKRTAFEPIDFFALVDHGADDGDGRGLEFFALGGVGDVGEGAGDGAMSSGGGPAGEGDGSVRFSSVFDKLGSDFAETGDTHHEDLGAGRFGELVVVEGGFLFGGVFVTGENGELGVVCAVGDGDAGIGRAADGGGDARHDFKRDSGLREFGSFFATASKNHGVAALESADRFAFEGLLDNESVDLVLGDGVVLRALASKDFFAAGLGPVEKFRATEGVVDEDVAGLDALLGLESGETDVSGASADEIADSFHLARTLAEMRGIFNRFSL